MFRGLRLPGQRKELEEVCKPTSVHCQCLLSEAAVLHKVPERNSSQERRHKPQDAVVSAMSSRDFAGLASVSPDHPLLVADSRPRFSICHFDSGKQVVPRVLSAQFFRWHPAPAIPASSRRCPERAWQFLCMLAERDAMDMTGSLHKPRIPHGGQCRG
jgi:hypothetical protein